MDTTHATLTATEVIDRVRTARTIAHTVAVEEVQLALQWALLHPAREDSPAAGWGWVDLDADHPTPLAGPGTPLVDEFAPASLAAALSITLDAAKHLIADALELTYRLPRLWAWSWPASSPSGEHGRSPGRPTTSQSRPSPTPTGSSPPPRTRSARSTPPAWSMRPGSTSTPTAPPRTNAAHSRSAASGSGTGGNPGDHRLVMTLDTPDAELFNETVTDPPPSSQPSATPTTLDVRRARAVGILADPQHALDLLSGREAEPSTAPGAMNLYVHLTPDDLEGTGATTIEKLGAATTQLLDEWVTRHTTAGGKINLRPVLDLTDGTSMQAVDQHDPPDAMRELVRPPRQPLRLPRLPTRLPDLRPRPHHPLHPDRRRRTTRPNTPRQPGPVVPTPPPAQDPHRLGLQTPRRRQLHLDRTHRPPVRRPPDVSSPTATKNLTPRHPGQPRRGLQHASAPTTATKPPSETRPPQPQRSRGTPASSEEAVG